MAGRPTVGARLRRLPLCHCYATSTILEEDISRERMWVINVGDAVLLCQKVGGATGSTGLHMGASTNDGLHTVTHI